MENRMELTDRQREVYDYIRRRSQESRFPPTVREIGEVFHISSTNGVRSILAALIKKGYIRRSPRLSRGIEVIGEEWSPQVNSESSALAGNVSPALVQPSVGSGSAVDPQAVEIPILGCIAAGQPILAVQNLEGTVTVDRDFLARQKNVFALRVKGDSMINAGIFDGDLVFARQQNTAERGQIVVAQVGDEATVKYYQPRETHVELLPANPAHRPIVVPVGKEFSIAGRVIGVMRRIA